jgi:hypothetical protein
VPIIKLVDTSLHQSHIESSNLHHSANREKAAARGGKRTKLWPTAIVGSCGAVDLAEIGAVRGCTADRIERHAADQKVVVGTVWPKRVVGQNSVAFALVDLRRKAEI